MSSNLIITENELVNFFLNNTESTGNQSWVTEVPVFSKSVDLVKTNITNNEVTAIEFKIGKWRKAIEQVIGVSIAFDYLEICLLEPKTEKCRNIIIQDCMDKGIGLYFVDYEKRHINHIVQPISRLTIWQRQKEQIIKYIQGRTSNE